MAIKWSWAFGAETALQLKNEMGWDMDSTDPNLMAPSQTFIYSYPGSPTTGPSARYSMRTDFDKNMIIPRSAWSNEGWVTIALYGNTNAVHPNGRVIEVYGSDAADSIWFQIETSGLVSLYVDSTLVDTFTPAGLGFNWNYWALRYTMSGSTWGATLFLNGVEILSGSKSGGGVQPEPGPNGVIQFQAPYNAQDANYFGQIICYDSLSDAGEKDHLFVTRVNPTVDTSTAGTWLPSVGSDDFAVLSASFDSSTETVNASAVGGNNVVVQADVTITTQIGTTPNTVYGVTLHAWGSGSGLNAFTGVSDANTLYDTGSHITPDTNDPTYCFASSVIKPDGGGAWTGADVPFMKYEVTGS